MIYLQPHSGLANRIRVIVSGLKLADVTGQKLVVIWNKDAGLNCNFYTLFEKNDRIIVRKGDIKINILDRLKNKPFLKKIVYKIFSIDFSLFDHNFMKYVWNRNTANLDMSLLPNDIKNYYIKSCNEFLFDPKFLEYLKPVPKIRLLIDEAKKEFSAMMIGIHIRRTDHTDAVIESPLESFIKVMKDELKQDPGIKYFLATDDPSVENELRSLFPSKIISVNKIFTRNSPEGIIGAMVDLYCLSATNKIYGSFTSSFSNVAARIGNIPLSIVRKTN